MAARPWHILFAEDYADSTVERARAVARVTVLDSCDEATLLGAIPDCDALLVRTRAQVTPRVLESAKRLCVIGRGGVGLENIDVGAARERGVQVVYTPAAATDAVADLTVGLIINLVRRIGLGDAAVRAGQFAKGRYSCIGRALSELTLGIVGMGRIGRAVARRCRQGFGLTILYNDIVRIGHLDFTATSAEKQRLYRDSDIVSLHVPLTNETRGLIDTTVLAQFKPGALLVNTSRGAVVDGVALAEALEAGKLGGAALDVFAPEPLPSDHPLMYAPNTLFVPHVGARTPDALARMNDVIDDVIAVLQGKPPRYPAS